MPFCCCRPPCCPPPPQKKTFVPCITGSDYRYARSSHSGLAASPPGPGHLLAMPAALRGSDMTLLDTSLTATARMSDGPGTSLSASPGLTGSPDVVRVSLSQGVAAVRSGGTAAPSMSDMAALSRAQPLLPPQPTASVTGAVTAGVSANDDEVLAQQAGPHPSQPPSQQVSQQASHPSQLSRARASEGGPGAKQLPGGPSTFSTARAASPATAAVAAAAGAMAAATAGAAVAAAAAPGPTAPYPVPSPPRMAGSQQGAGDSSVSGEGGGSSSQQQQQQQQREQSPGAGGNRWRGTTSPFAAEAVRSVPRKVSPRERSQSPLFPHASMSPRLGGRRCGFLQVVTADWVEGHCRGAGNLVAV